MTYDSSGVYVDTVHIAGCDSIITLDLTINESYDDVVDTMYNVSETVHYWRAVIRRKLGVCEYVTVGV